MDKRTNQYTPLEQNLNSNSTTAAPSIAAVAAAIGNTSKIVVEQNLTSNSSTSVPSIAAIVPLQNAINSNTASIATKVEKVSGKDLSTNDYSTTDKNKLNSLTNTVIEQNLTSNSTTSVPSIAAVRYAFNSVNTNAWFSSTTYTNITANSTTTINPAVINFIPGNSQLRIDLDTTNANLNYNLTHDNNAVSGAGSVVATIIDFTNGTTLDNKTRWLLYPGDYLTFIRDSSKNCRVIEAGNSRSLRALQVPSTSTRQTVKAGTFVNGELQGTQPADSIIHQNFCDANYRYQYETGKDDINGDTYVWIRTAKL